MSVDLLQGDCREVMPTHGPFDMILADPPYGDTSLDWDRRVRGWEHTARGCLKPTGSMWVFGSLRFFMDTAADFRAAGWRYSQEVAGQWDWPDPQEAGHVVWEKQNGSGFQADRFKRVHELAVQFCRDDAPWGDVYNDVQTTPDAVARQVRRKKKPAHLGETKELVFVSEDGGPRIMRSVIYARNCHGRAIHPTQKPVDLLEILIRTSCPKGGLVGDFFAGSGSGGEACQLTGRNYVGCEINPAYAAAAQARLASVLPFGEAA